jgi:hypothetical protein
MENVQRILLVAVATLRAEKAMDLTEIGSEDVTG